MEMNLICPKCKSFLIFGNGHDSDPQNCLDPHEFCPNKKCDFVIFYEPKPPDPKPKTNCGYKISDNLKF